MGAPVEEPANGEDPPPRVTLGYGSFRGEQILRLSRQKKKRVTGKVGRRNWAVCVTQVLSRFPYLLLMMRRCHVKVPNVAPMVARGTYRPLRGHWRRRARCLPLVCHPWRWAPLCPVRVPSPNVPVRPQLVGRRMRTNPQADVMDTGPGTSILDREDSFAIVASPETQPPQISRPRWDTRPALSVIPFITQLLEVRRQPTCLYEMNKIRRR